VTIWCRMLGVTGRVFYQWKKRGPSQRDRDDSALKTRIQSDLCAGIRAGRGTAGHAEAAGRRRAGGLQAGAAAEMRKLGLVQCAIRGRPADGPLAAVEPSKAAGPGGARLRPGRAEPGVVRRYHVT